MPDNAGDALHAQILALVVSNTALFVETAHYLHATALSPRKLRECSLQSYPSYGFSP